MEIWEPANSYTTIVTPALLLNHVINFVHCQFDYNIIHSVTTYMYVPCS